MPATDAPRSVAATARDPEPRQIVPPETSIIVTIDGPAGTGKSTVAHALATALGVDVLDTGAMYRAAAAIAIDRKLSLDEPEKIVETLVDADLHFDWSQDPPAILAWMRPLNERIRKPDVTARVSKIAAIKELREHLVRKQRIIAAQHPRLVSEGRDQGSVVFPDADVKFYLDADPRVRAERRAEQLAEAGQTVTIDEVYKRILERDHLDSTRTDGPLVCPDDAITIDTTRLTFDEVVETLRREVVARIPQLRRAPGV